MGKDDSQFSDLDHWEEGDIIHHGWKNAGGETGFGGKKIHLFGGHKRWGNLELQRGNQAGVPIWASLTPLPLLFPQC